MKKILLATTAAAGVAAIAGSAVAAEAPTMSISGNIQYQMQFYDNEDGRVVGGNADDQGVDISADAPGSELRIQAAAMADNGLEYGGDIQLRYNNGGATAPDETYMYFGGSWGRIHLGDDDGAVDNTIVGGESALAATGGYDGDIADHWGTNGVGHNIAPTSVGGGGDNSKIAYYSPSFSGFSVAASYEPEAAGFTSNNPSAQTNTVEIAAAYSGNFDAVSLTLAAGYRNAGLHGANDDNSIVEDISAFELGALVGFGGFELGLGYGDNSDSGCAAGAAVNAANAGCDAGFYWTAGIGYSAGPISIGAGYMYAEDTPGAGVVGDDESNQFTVGATYVVAEGLSTFAEYGYGEFDRAVAAGAANNDVENQTFLIGTALSF